MNRVLLFSLDKPHIKVTIEAYFDDEGNLVVEGYDIGKSVEEYWGDSDYEYSATVQKGDLGRLCDVLGVSPHNLLAELQRRFNTNSCYSQYVDFLGVNKVPYKGFSWR